MPPNLERLNAALAHRYAIEHEIGEGGMATVYLAQDVKHERQVAIKVLRPELAAVVGSDRFISEIKTTANLQHPHILPLYDSGEADGFLFYVMPFISGETLQDKLNREKQLPVDEAVRLARSVASALDYAHRHGVIHRDIKPANILVHEGQALVADFGIALAVQHAGGGRLTETGLSLGTPFYMSPEQATGDRDPDARSDIYSLGCMLYEMLVGEPPFTGSTAQSVLAKILTGEAPLVTHARKAVPPHVAGAVARATQRLPADRFPTGDDFARALADPSFRFGEAEAAATSPGEGGGSGNAGPWKAATLVLALASLALAAVALLRGGAAAPTPPLLLRVVMPDSQQILSPADLPSLRLSDDGSTAVYVGPAPNGTQLWVKRRGEAQPTPLAATLNPTIFAVSPDGSEVAFVLGNVPALQVMPSVGGTPRTAADTALAVGLDWGEDGYLYFQSVGSGINRVPSAGGAPEQMTKADVAGKVFAGDHAWPHLLPGGERLLFTLWGNTPAADSIAVLEMASGEMHTLTAGVNAQYVPPGFLLVGDAQGTLSAAPFDAGAGAITGAFRPVAGEVRVLTPGALDFDVSASGTLTYVQGGGVNVTPVWVDMAGNAEPVQEGWEGAASMVSLSPDGTKIAIAMFEGNRPDVWVKRLDRAASPAQRITFQEADVVRPIWLPGSDSVLFLATPPGEQNQITARRWDGAGTHTTLLDADHRGVDQPYQAVDVSSDGRWLVYRVGGGNSTRDIYALQRGVDTVGVPLIATGANEHSPALSPDGRFLAYGSNESGSDEIYVRTFPDVGGGKWQVSADGGREPVWSPDGRTLYYRNRNSEMVAARWDGEEAGGIISREVLFKADAFYSDPVHSSFDIAPDGRRFLMLRFLNRTDTGLIWIENFAAGLAAERAGGR